MNKSGMKRLKNWSRETTQVTTLVINDFLRSTQYEMISLHKLSWMFYQINLRKYFNLNSTSALS
ncbi:hypothetical protein XBFFR1_2240023 [Xenorhabdus bovienii str. feltiae France]|nr:hypothetical protein XBFFR1_2240023 [Xenorhabdus bovienii str. feltiae France]